MLALMKNLQKMSPENFCYWLQGLFELQPDLKELTTEQVQMIKQHLQYVFEGKKSNITFNPSDVTTPYIQQQPVRPVGPHVWTPFINPQLPNEFTVVC
jgi:hypothetical protein